MKLILYTYSNANIVLCKRKIYLINYFDIKKMHIDRFFILFHEKIVYFAKLIKK